MSKKYKRTITTILTIMLMTSIVTYAAEPKPSIWDICSLSQLSTENNNDAVEVIFSPLSLFKIPQNETPVYEQVSETAHKYLGVKYVWGGASPNGFDCSGLAQYVYNELGISISRTTYTQVKEGKQIEKEDLRTGDLVFFKKKSGEIHHVGIYIGNGQMIHAPQSGDVVKISNLADRNDYATARRIIE